MWTCTLCNRSFRNSNQSHSCKPVSKENITGTISPALQPVYKKIIKIINRFGPYREEPVGKHVIYFKTASTFMAIKLKKDHLEVEFFLDHKITAPVVTKMLQTSANRFACTVPVSNTGEINQELASWLNCSYELVKK